MSIRVELVVCVAAFTLAGCAGNFAQVATSSGGKPAPSPGLDSDKDGLTDQRERDLRTNPFKPDTDGDGFDDGFEDLYGAFGFDPSSASKDSDGDGLEDSEEKRLGTRIDSPDTDADGWSDFDEVLNARYGFDPLKPSIDSDFDGLTDDLEQRIGSSANNADTNGDGVEDFVAFDAGLNPADKSPATSLGELVGTAESPAMRAALIDIRRGGHFPAALASELPFAAVQKAIAAAQLKPSAALMLRSAYNPHHSPGIYPPYNEIVSHLFDVANQFNGTNGPDLVRLFVWSQPTLECCGKGMRVNKAGRRIYAMKISDKPGQNEGDEPEIAFFGNHHARELITATFPVDLIDRLTGQYATDAAIRKIVDSTEIWVIAVVNPNGYDHVVLAQDLWRKNTRRVTAAQTNFGVDVNRNYGWQHITTVPAAQHAALPTNAKDSNGLNGSGAFDMNTTTFGGQGPMTEVETQAVAGLAHDQFNTKERHQIDGLICSLSWHTYTGLVLSPYSHSPTTPTPGVPSGDRAIFDKMSDAYVSQTNYLNVHDKFAQLRTGNGDPFDGYPVWGDGADWLYEDGKTHAVTVEGYSKAEGQTGQSFYPTVATQRDAVSAANVNGALAFIRTCQSTH